jgi:asparagine synthetase B (glutamine-hydrolysing)
VKHAEGDGSWLAALRAAGSAGADGCRALELETLPDWAPSASAGPSYRVIFDGVLYNRDELRTQFSELVSPEPTDADLVGHAYRRWGEDAIARLKGIFALVIVDLALDLRLCARDPLGIHPLFYAEVEGTLLLSPSIDTLLAQAGVSAELNRACLVARLTRRWLAGDETYFTHVRRVPPGHIVRLSGHNDRRAYRYWNPVPADGSIQWIPDDDAQERFEALLEQAVARCLAPGRPGIFMSGGLDSSTLAMVATELCRRQGADVPWALSLLFSEPGGQEAVVQHGVAMNLGLPHQQLQIENAAGRGGTLASALEMTRSMPAPLTLIWRPALQRLAIHGREQGCRVILAGDGADEWLWENPILAADLLRSLDFGGLYRLWYTYAHSYHFSRWHAFRIVRWHAKRLLRDVGYSVAARAGAGRLVRRHLRSKALQVADSPPWVAPDPKLRAQVAERLEAAYVRDETDRGRDTYYSRDTRSRLDSADKWFREEETFLVGRRMGTPVREPFWDPDLIELLVRVRPQARSAGGLAKALVRRPLARRFPELGFEAQRKSNLGEAFLSVLCAEAGFASQAVGELKALVGLGVIDGAQVRAVLDDALAGRSDRTQVSWAWEVLNLETWTRSRG